MTKMEKQSLFLIAMRKTSKSGRAAPDRPPCGARTPRRPTTAARKIPLQPPIGGSVFRVVEFAPDADTPDGPGVAEQLGAHQAEGSAARHAGTHRTDSIDYAIVMSGEIDMLMDEEKDDVHVKAGDVIIQRGTNHAWANRGDKPCQIAFILIDADPAI
jgi:mannose-6-phosphate isomerase-like protein (cupin superfamily)